MANALTSWKEIARYVGKGVRTVQRWERELAFPVRRPHHRAKGMVLAIPQEIDAWVHAQRTSHADQAKSELAKLRKVVAALEAENEKLRHQREAVQPRTPAPPNGKFCLSNPLYMTVLAQSVHLLNDAAFVQQECAESCIALGTCFAPHLTSRLSFVYLGTESVTRCHRLRVTAAQLRLQAIESQLSAALTFCAMAEAALGHGRVDEAHRLIQKVRHVPQTVSHHLDEPNHVPPDQVNEAYNKLAQLESRVLGIEAQLTNI